MANPDNYAVASGQPVYAGRSAPAGFPSWISSMAVDTWALVPGSTMAAVNPKNNAAMNPVYPGSPEWYAVGQSAIVGAWNSAAINPITGDVYVWGGGHADYGGNEVYKQSLMSATPNWQVMRAPSGSIGNRITDGAIGADSTSGVYSDGRPRPTHTYNSLVYVPGKGMAVTNLYYVYANLGGPGKAVYFSDATNDWALLSDYTALGDANAKGGGCCYDSLRNCVWLLGQGAYNMVKIDCATGVATRYGAVGNHSINCLLKYDTTNDLVYILGSTDVGQAVDYPSNLTAFDPVTNLFHVIPTSGSLPAGLSQYVNTTSAGWDDAAGVFYLWGDQTSRAGIGTITRPAGNPRTATWTKGSRTLSAANAITPTAPQVAGTFGRFDYVPALGGCFLLNAVDQQTYFYKIKAIP